MGCEGSRGGLGKSLRGERGQDWAKTWSQRRAKHAALKTPSPVPPSPPPAPVSTIYISSEGSEAEDSGELPDLDATFQPLGKSSGHHGSGFFASTRKKPFTMGSPRRMPTKERHFLDSFQPTLKCRKTKEDCEGLKSTEEVKSIKVGSKTKADLSRKRKDRISQEMQAGSTPVYQEYKVFKFPPDTTLPLSAERKPQDADPECRQLRNKFSGVRFLQDLTTLPFVVDRLCSDFVKMQTSCLDDLLDDLCDPTHFSHCMDLLEDFCFRRKPSPMSVDKVMTNGFFRAVDDSLLFRTYHFVLKLWQRFPDLVKIDVQSVLVFGDVLQKHLQNTMSSSGRNTGSNSWGQKGDAGTGKPSIQKCRLYFQLFVKGLQLSLSGHTLADQKSVNKSLAFACLSSEGSRTLVKQLTHWLEFCLVVMHQEHVAMAKVWMCELQTLLSVHVLVSRDRQDAAKRLAPELKRTYKYLTNLGTKKRLLQSFLCPLLLFYVLRLVMEDQCESTIVSSQFPSSIEEIIHNYYVALPPQDHLTPPPSPSEDGQEVGRRPSQLCSVQSCEELAMLVYFITRSFIACKQSTFTSPRDGTFDTVYRTFAGICEHCAQS
ncbi:hypothetical protein ACOMHN_064259 [Nucella lapillus]